MPGPVLERTVAERRGGRQGAVCFPEVLSGEGREGWEPLDCPTCCWRECGSTALRPEPGINCWPLQRHLLKMFLIKVQEDLYVQYLLA